MKSLTYRQLRDSLNKLNDEQLECNVSVYDNESDEYHPVVREIEFTEQDVLDAGHPIIIIN